MSYYRIAINKDTPESWGWGFEDPRKQYTIQLCEGDMRGNFAILAEGVSLSDVDNKSVTLTEITGDDLVKLKAYKEVFNSPPKPEQFGFE